MSSGSTTFERPSGFVAFVGAGPGDEGLLTLRGADLLSRADIVILDQEAYGSLLRHCREGVEIIGVAEEGAVSLKAVKAAKGGSCVVRLCAGDPMFFSSITAEVAACAKAEVDFEIVPGVPPATAVLTMPGYRPRYRCPSSGSWTRPRSTTGPGTPRERAPW